MPRKTTGNYTPMTWQDTAHQFNEQAAQYDNWYQDSPVFDIELAALKAIQESLPRPALEIGVGPGHFAKALQTEFGIDPAISPLHLAACRSIIAMNGVGEYLPVRSGSIGTIYLLFTLCFLNDPAAVLRECRRILTPGGRLVLGMVPKHSSWGKRICERRKRNHPLYRHARLQTITKANSILDNSGFNILESWSTLLQPPSKSIQNENPMPGLREDAGFNVLVTGNKGEYR